MGILTRMRKQAAVYWAPAGLDRHGKATFAEAVQLDGGVRWEDVVEEFTDATTGAKELSNCRVYVGEDLQVGGVLWLGTLASVTYLTEPLRNEKAYRVRRFDSVPNIRATQFLRTAML